MSSQLIALGGWGVDGQKGGRSPLEGNFVKPSKVWKRSEKAKPIVKEDGKQHFCDWAKKRTKKEWRQLTPEPPRDINQNRKGRPVKTTFRMPRSIPKAVVCLLGGNGYQILGNVVVVLASVIGAKKCLTRKTDFIVMNLETQKRSLTRDHRRYICRNCTSPSETIVNKTIDDLNRLALIFGGPRPAMRMWLKPSDDGTKIYTTVLPQKILEKCDEVKPKSNRKQRQQQQHSFDIIHKKKVSTEPPESLIFSQPQQRELEKRLRNGMDLTMHGHSLDTELRQFLFDIVISMRETQNPIKTVMETVSKDRLSPPRLPLTRFNERQHSEDESTLESSTTSVGSSLVFERSTSFKRFSLSTYNRKPSNKNPGGTLSPESIALSQDTNSKRISLFDMQSQHFYSPGGRSQSRVSWIPMEEDDEDVQLKMTSFLERMREQTILVFILSRRNWAVRIKSKLKENIRDNQLADQLNEWNLSKTKYFYKSWKTHFLWCNWKRKRYLRKTWDAWQVLVQQATDNKTAARLRLGTAMIKCIFYKTFKVWKRLTIIESMAAVPNINMFDNELVIGGWLEFFNNYITERSLTIKMSGFLRRHQLLLCFNALILNAQHRCKMAKLKVLELQYSQHINKRLLSSCVKSIWRRVLYRQSGYCYMERLISTSYTTWKMKFLNKNFSRYNYLHMRRRCDHRITETVFNTWRQKQRQFIAARVLCSARCIQYRSAMLPSAYLLSGGNLYYLVWKIFNFWSAPVKLHTRFVEWVSRSIISSESQLLKAAFLAWKSGCELDFQPFDWARAESLRKSISKMRPDDVSVLSARYYIEAESAKLQSTPMNVKVSYVNRQSYSCWLSSVGSIGTVVIRSLFSDILTLSLVSKTLLRYRNSCKEAARQRLLQTFSISQSPPVIASTRQSYVGDCYSLDPPFPYMNLTTSKSFKIKYFITEKQCAVQDRLNAREPLSKKIKKELPHFIPRFYTTYNTINEVAIYSWIINGLFEARAGTVGLLCKDSLTITDNAIDFGLPFTQHSEISKKAKAIERIRRIAAKKRQNHLLSRLDITEFKKFISNNKEGVTTVLRKTRDIPPPNCSLAYLVSLVSEATNCMRWDNCYFSIYERQIIDAPCQSIFLSYLKPVTALTGALTATSKTLTQQNLRHMKSYKKPPKSSLSTVGQFFR